MVGSIEHYIRQDLPIQVPWVGFIHNVMHHPPEIAKLYGERNDLDLKKMMKKEAWQKSFPFCKGIFCLSAENAHFFKDHVPVEIVFHPTEIPETKFSWERFIANDSKKVVVIGHWMRNFQAIYDLKSPYDKCILKGVGKAFRYDRIREVFSTNDSVTFIPRLSDEEYDHLLSENLVFLNLFGSSANNTVVECIVRHTPIVVNRLPALEEYLGKDYPLFYDNLTQAAELIADTEALFAAHEKLKTIKKVSPEKFLESVYNSEIYRSLPVCLPKVL
jgi:hypothetical protein